MYFLHNEPEKKQVHSEYAGNGPRSLCAVYDLRPSGDLEILNSVRVETGRARFGRWKTVRVESAQSENGRAEIVQVEIVLVRMETGRAKLVRVETCRVEIVRLPGTSLEILVDTECFAIPQVPLPVDSHQGRSEQVAEPP